MPIMATPLPGDAHTWRRPNMVTTASGDAQLVNLLTFSPGPLGGSHHVFDFDFDFDFDFGQRLRTGRYKS